MKSRSLILSILLLLPCVISNAQEHKDSLQVIPLDYGVRERKPTFNGGDANEFAKWVKEHQRYPRKAKKAEIEGRVYLSFKINERGEMVDLKVLRSTNKIFEREALRVVRSAPDKWEPGLNVLGEPISITYTFPVIFYLPKE